MDYDKLSATLRDAEGVRFKAYDDATGRTAVSGEMIVGNITIGIGRNLVGKGLSQEEMLYLLKNDMESSADFIRAIIGEVTFDAMSDARQRAFTEMCFSLGTYQTRQFKVALGYARLEEYGKCADALLESTWAKELPGRVLRISGMIRTGADAT